MENKTFKRTTVTSALPYANGGVHIGHLADGGNTRPHHVCDMGHQ